MSERLGQTTGSIPVIMTGAHLALGAFIAKRPTHHQDKGESQ